MKLLDWLNEPVTEPRLRWKVLGLWLILLALVGLILALGEGLGR